MMRQGIAVLLVFGFAGCGVDGEPSFPEPKDEKQTKISISGRAEVGATVKR